MEGLKHNFETRLLPQKYASELQECDKKKYFRFHSCYSWVLYIYIACHIKSGPPRDYKSSLLSCLNVIKCAHKYFTNLQ